MGYMYLLFPPPPSTRTLMHPHTHIVTKIIHLVCVLGGELATYNNYG